MTLQYGSTETWELGQETSSFFPAPFVLLKLQSHFSWLGHVPLSDFQNWVWTKKLGKRENHWTFCAFFGFSRRKLSSFPVSGFRTYESLVWSFIRTWRLETTRCLLNTSPFLEHLLIYHYKVASWIFIWSNEPKTFGHPHCAQLMYFFRYYIRRSQGSEDLHDI